MFLSHSAKDKAMARPLAERLGSCRAEAARRRRKDRLRRSQCRFQPLAFSLQPFPIGSLALFVCAN